MVNDSVAYTRKDSRLENEFESIQKDWMRLATDVSKALKDVVAYSKTEAGAKKEELKAELEKHLGDLRGEIESVVKKNPWKSVFVAFGLGLLVSKLLERKSK